MKSVIAASLVAVALSLAALGAVLLGTGARSASGELGPRTPAADLGLARRLDELVEENGNLRARLAMLEARPAPPQRSPVVDDAVTRAEFDALSARVREGLEARAAVLPAPVELEEQVADALVVVRKQEAVAKLEDYQEKRLERLDESVGKVTEWLELDSYQSTELRKSLAAQYEREAELRRLWEAGEDDEVLGARKLADRETFGAELATFLTSEQLQRFWAGARGREK